MGLLKNVYFLTAILVILFLIANFSQAGEVVEEWVAWYNNGGVPTAMAIDSSDNVYVTGYNFGNETRLDYVTVKYDTSGNQKWAACYNGPNDSDDWAFDIAVDSSGNAYVTGGSNSDYTTIKYDPNGSQLWVACYNGPTNNLDWAKAIALDNLGYIYVTGFSRNGSENKDFATIKYDPNGNQKWVARYDGHLNSNDEAQDIALDSLGNVYVTGYSTWAYYDYTTIKYDPNGNEKWVALYNGSGNYNDCAYDIAIDSSSNVYVTGYTCSVTTADDYGTIKYDTNGNQKWVARYNRAGYSFDYAKALSLDNSGNVYITGYSRGGNGDPNGDYVTVKYDSDGNQLWAAHYNGPGNGADFARDIDSDSLGNIYVTGFSDGNGTDSDYATIKYDPNGNQKWIVRYNGLANGEDSARAVAVNDSGDVFVTGYSTESETNDGYTTIKYSQGDAINKPCVILTNNSTSTLCAEEDNVNMPLYGMLTRFTIEATHPEYAVTTYDCPPNFDNCPPLSGDDYEFTPAELKLYDNGVWVVWAYRLSRFWRPQGMTASAAGGPLLEDTHYIAISKKVTGENSWPQFLVLYSDGNIRLIPHPPVGQTSVCFGSSVIIGPAEPLERPIAEIEAVSYQPSDNTLTLIYRQEGSAKLNMSVDRAIATITVDVNYPMNEFPFATFRSMFVDEGNCDTAKVTIWDNDSLVSDSNVLEVNQNHGDEFFFYRQTPSAHNMSAPDIKIKDFFKENIADLNRDSHVDFIDFARFATYWLESECCICGGANINCDEDVDYEDLYLLVSSWLMDK